MKKALDIHTGIACAQVREDIQVEKAHIYALHRHLDRPIRVAMIGSGGCGVIDLLGCREVGQIDVIDANPGQLALLEAKIKTLQHAPEEHLADLFGYSEQKEEERAEMFERLVMPHLSPSAVGYLQAHPQIQCMGLDQCGRFEGLFHELRESILPGRSKEWPEAFKRVFSRAHLTDVFGPEAVDYSMSQEFDAHFQRVFIKAITSNPKNLYLRKAVASISSLRADMNIILQKKKEGLARFSQEQLDERLKIHHCTMMERLKDDSGKFRQEWDLIHISNIMDWLPHSDAMALLLAARERLTQHGLVVGRRLNGDYCLQDSMSQVFETSHLVNESLHKMETAFFYDEVVSGSLSPRAVMAMEEYLTLSDQ